MSTSTLPAPGFWRPIECANGRVVRYAWTCPGCRKIEYVLAGPRGMALGAVIEEHCSCKRIAGRLVWEAVRLLDEREYDEADRDNLDPDDDPPLACDGCGTTTGDLIDTDSDDDEWFVAKSEDLGWLVTGVPGQWDVRCPGCANARESAG